MKIDINIHVTPGTARRIAYLGLTLLIGGVATVAFAVPVTFVSQQKLTAAQLNQNFADLEAKLTAATAAIALKADTTSVPSVTGWTPYTPVVSTNKGAVVEGQSTTGFYRRVGDSLEVSLVTWFSAEPNSGAIWWQWSLPQGLAIDLSRTAPDGAAIVGSGLAQQGPANVALLPYVRSPNSVSAVPNGGTSYRINDTSPVAFGSGSSISLIFSVPIEGWAVTQ